MQQIIDKLKVRKKGYLTRQAGLKADLKDVNKRIQEFGFRVNSGDLLDIEKRLILQENAILQGRMAELDYILKQLK